MGEIDLNPSRGPFWKMVVMLFYIEILGKTSLMDVLGKTSIMDGCWMFWADLPWS